MQAYADANGLPPVNAVAAEPFPIAEHLPDDEDAATAVLDPLSAAGRLFSEIAADLHTAVEVLHEAIQSPAPAPLLLAVCSMLEKSGAAADRAGQCTGAAGVKDPDSWLLSPRGADALAVLQQQHWQALAARHAEPSFDGGAA